MYPIGSEMKLTQSKIIFALLTISATIVLAASMHEEPSLLIPDDVVCQTYPYQHSIHFDYLTEC